MAREIPGKYVGKIDQDLATARSNLRLHIADFERFLDQGDAPEVVFAGFAQQMFREAPSHHLATMFAAAVLTLTEEKRKAPSTVWIGDLSGFRVEQGPDDGSGRIEFYHRCGWYEDVYPADQHLGNLVEKAMRHRGQGCA